MPKQGVKTYMARRMKEWEQRIREKMSNVRRKRAKRLRKKEEIRNILIFLRLLGICPGQVSKFL